MKRRAFLASIPAVALAAKMPAPTSRHFRFLSGGLPYVFPLWHSARVGDTVSFEGKPTVYVVTSARPLTLLPA